MNPLAAVLSHAKITSQDALCGGCAQQYNNFRLHYFDFGVQPRAAGGNLDGIGLFMNTPLAARLPLEVLHNIRYVNIIAIDAGCGQSFVQHRACRAYEWPALKVLFVSRLLAYHHHASVGPALAEYGLRSEPPKITSCTSAGSLPQVTHIRSWGDARRGSRRHHL